jgi:hypothetical protein
MMEILYRGRKLPFKELPARPQPSDRARVKNAGKKEEGERLMNGKKK